MVSYRQARWQGICLKAIWAWQASVIWSSSSASSWKTVGTYKTIKGIAVTFPEAPEGETGLRYFEEQPLLPHLMNYAEVKVKSSSSSSSNGKVTAASYGFAPAKKGTSAKKVLDQYLEALKRSGLEVMGGDSGYVIMSGSTVLAKIVLEKDVIQFTLIP